MVEQRSRIVVADRAADRADAPALIVESLAEGVTAAQIATDGVVARIEPGKDLGLRIACVAEVSDANSNPSRLQIRATSR